MTDERDKMANELAVKRYENQDAPPVNCESEEVSGPRIYFQKDNRKFVYVGRKLYAEVED